MTASTTIPVSPAQLALTVAGHNTAEAVRLLSILVDEGNTEASLLLGQLFLDGRDIPIDQPRAATLFQQAAEQNSAMGFNMLGRCYEHGWGVEQNTERAAHYYQKASQKGLDWGHYNLANLYATGRGLTQDHQQAFTLYQKAALQGHAKSMNLVGRYYQEGICVARNENTATQWYMRSAEAGDFRGQISLAGVLADQGDIKSAVFWLRKAMLTANTAALSKLYPDLLNMPHIELQEIGKAIQAKLLSAAS